MEEMLMHLKNTITDGCSTATQIFKAISGWIRPTEWIILQKHLAVLKLKKKLRRLKAKLEIAPICSLAICFVKGGELSVSIEAIYIQTRKQKTHTTTTCQLIC